MTLGRWGVAGTDIVREHHPSELQPVLEALEQAGVGTIWFGENVGGESFATAGVLLARSSTLVVATGVANMAARAPASMAAGRRILGDAYRGRFALGIGVSHRSIVEAYGGTPDPSPLAALGAYLDAMDTTPGGPGDPPAPVLFAALGPRMLELTAARGLGVHAWNVTPAHTASARAVVGPGPLVAPRQAVLLCDDAAAARAAGRAHLSKYLAFANYRKAWRQQGFGDDDLVGGGSDRLVDAMVAWGPPGAVLARLREHRDAGADHVAVHALPRPGMTAAEAVHELLEVLPS